jgi:GAF domain-containing protein
MRDLVAVTVDDFDTEDRWPSLRDDDTASGVRSSLSIPLEHAARTLGGLNMYADRTGAFTEESRHAAEAFARQAVMLLRSLQQLHSERASHAREHDVAAALQPSLLPTLPTVPGITSSPIPGRRDRCSHRRELVRPLRALRRNRGRGGR